MKRLGFIQRIEHAFRVTPVVAILGPRQCGKTTLAHQFGDSRAIYFDLEDERDLVKLDDPFLTLESLKGLVVIDEIQRAPDLFKTLRVLVDRPGRKSRFLILGSASRDLIRQSSETLAGRISYLELTPFSCQELGEKNIEKLWVRGGFPRSFLASSSNVSAAWRMEYVSTFLERDIPALGFRIPFRLLRRFWTMLAHYHGQIFNASEIGQSLGLAHTTVRHYLDILCGTFMIRQLNPWVENMGKRLVKSPKIYFRDSGILHTFLETADERALKFHPKVGSSWEGFALEEVIRSTQARNEEIFFWATHNQAELDLLISRENRRIGFEFKRTSSPHLTRSMQIALKDIKLSELIVIFPGIDEFPLAPHVKAIGLKKFISKRAKIWA
ncbi:MAG: ATP-binding protein [Elusimicrobia bacterium]|nr:ATP-binding protein [Elusimicrobiota bacterium]